jgi:hypothetical protein
MDKQAVKTREVIRVNPGKDGTELCKLYRPASRFLRKLELGGYIEWHKGGWYVTEKAIKD